MRNVGFAGMIMSGMLMLGVTQAQADTFGASASVAYWRADHSGTVQNGGGDIGIDNDLGFHKSSFAVMSFSFEHPVPFLPDFKFQYYKMDQVANGTVPTGKTYDGFNGKVHTDLDLSNYDLTLFYQPLDNWVHLDLGLTGKVFNGHINVSEANGPQHSDTSINTVVPMLYAATRFDLPATGLSVGAEGNGVAYSGKHLYDVSAYVNYRVVVLNVQAGYRQTAIKVDDIDGIGVDAKIHGPYVQLGVAF